jgi:hypothetical protein
MNQTLQVLVADLLAAGVALHEAHAVRGLYSLALRRRDAADWAAFYHAVFAALNRIDTAEPPAPSAMRPAARAALLRLLEDDLGSTLFSRVEMSNLQAGLLEERLGRDAILYG